jgi:porphobilinogen synthase
MRRSAELRRLVRETRVCAADLIQPLFVAETQQLCGAVNSMPGVRRHALAELASVCDGIVQAGIPAVLLFGLPARKDPAGSQAYAPQGIVPRAVEHIRAAHPDLVIMADVCLCEYTDHGHCGLLEEGRLHNDRSLEALARTALAYAAAGVDVVAPSAMMDGMVAAIRSTLDQAGFEEVAVLSYAVKYASAFYGPFRDAAQCAPQFGDRRTHQMDPGNAAEAIAEVQLDLQEGADAVMVKPALPYLDVIRLVAERFPEVPLAAYQVSGEYSMIKAAAGHGWIDESACAVESLTAIKRAGADMIITYFAQSIAAHL